MDQVIERHEKPTEFTKLDMILIDKSGNETRRQMRQYEKEFEDKLTKQLMVFDAPAGVRGVAMLTWEKKEADDDQWLYLPALGRLRRVVGGGKRNYFMGTDFAHEDFETEDLDEHRYERKPDVVIGGKKHFVVDAFPHAPAVKKSTGYHFRRLYIRQENFLQYKIEFFERRSKRHLKTLMVKKAELIEGNTWRAKISIMQNFDKKHATRLEVISRDFSESAVNPKVFRPRFLKSKKHMR